MAKQQAIALCRVSTSKQRTEGSSLQAQEVRVRKCAEYLSVSIKRMWSLDTSSRKGKNVARKDLNEMFEVAKKDKTVKYIIVDEADRFMRSIEEAYWWKVQFKLINVTLAYANMPEITHEDNPMAVMKEMMAFFQAEISNHERITKTTEKMQAKIAAGYYPGRPHQGYKKSDIPGVHLPKEPHWSLLQSSMKKILYEGYSMQQALEWIIANGYTLTSGIKLDMYKYSRMLKQPYYAGIVKVKDWEVICEKGLHKAMITKPEYERLNDIVSGRSKKFTTNQYNPLFPASNIVECSDCVTENRHETRLVGYRHHNNKPERTRRWYERYRCRGCGKNILKSDLHSQLDKIFDSTKLIIDDKNLFINAARKVWKEDVKDNLEVASRLKQKITVLEAEKSNLVRTMSSNPDLADDFKSSIKSLKVEIAEINEEIERAMNIEKDFEQFVAFAIDYTQNIKANWWQTENAQDRIRFKQLVYKDGLKVSRSGKVLTPQLSPAYRYEKTKKTSENVSFAEITSFGGTTGA